MSDRWFDFYKIYTSNVLHSFLPFPPVSNLFDLPVCSWVYPVSYGPAISTYSRLVFPKTILAASLRVTSRRCLPPSHACILLTQYQEMAVLGSSLCSTAQLTCSLLQAEAHSVSQITSCRPVLISVRQSLWFIFSSLPSPPFPLFFLPPFISPWKRIIFLFLWYNLCLLGKSRLSGSCIHDPKAQYWIYVLYYHRNIHWTRYDS